MTEQLIKRLDKLFLKLNHMGLLVEQALSDVLFAVTNLSRDEATAVIEGDEIIDHREVEIERECIRLLALYQPAAIDLRRICFIIKVNNDLERIADLCVSMAKLLVTLIESGVSMSSFPTFQRLCDSVSDALHQTIRLVSLPPHNSSPTDPTNSNDTPSGIYDESALIRQSRWLIHNDKEHVDVLYREFLNEIVTGESNRDVPRLSVVYAATSIGRNLERIGDLCTNISEDMIFLATGEIVRHTSAENVDGNS
ncbi:MAG: phosphate signaling complex PhoU family protein [Thermoguttaceae bacterium]